MFLPQGRFAARAGRSAALAGLTPAAMLRGTRREAGRRMRAASYLWVAAGGALGSMARYWLADAVAGLLGAQFPWGTLLINIGGSFLIGWFGAWTGAHGPMEVPGDVRVFVMVGICGGFTTFSSFSLQTLELMQAGELVRAGAYILGSVVLCLLAVWAGVAMGRA